MSNVSGVIKSIQDIMRKDVGVDGDAQRISQLVWMFFLKIFDDREAELEVVEDNYHSPLPEHLRWRNWASNKEGITGDELSDFVNLQLFPSLKTLTGFQTLSGLRAQVIHNVFEDAYNYMKSGTLMRQVINKISEIDFNTKSDRHTFVRSAADEEILQSTIHGVEKKTMPHMLCTTNMILHGIDTPINIRHDNTLSRPLRDYTNKDRVHVIVTNPPFGGMEEDGIENNFPATLRSRETADLFLTLIIHLLKTEGRAALVLPDGFLFGEGIKTRIKEKLLAECNLHTIVRLPNGVFSPYTGIKTNLLFFTKGKPTESVWYYEHPYPDGVTSYNKTKPMRFEEFQPEIAWWGIESDGFSARVENETAWKVSIEELKARNYNLDIKNPHVGEQINHDPDKLLKQYTVQQKEILKLHDQLKSILSEALNRKEKV